MKRKSIYFILACVVAIVIIILPLLLRCSCIYHLIGQYLSVFRNTEYKGIYIETLGALFGAFLGVTGAVWAQNLANEHSKQEEMQKNARIIYADLDNSINSLKNICTDNDFPKSFADIIHANEETLSKFDQLVLNNQMVDLPNWKQMVFSISHCLSAEELRLLLKTYVRLTDIASMYNDYANMRSTLFVQLSELYDESASSPFSDLLDKLNIISKGILKRNTSAKKKEDKTK